MGYADIYGHWPLIKRKVARHDDSEQDQSANDRSVGAGGIGDQSDKPAVADKGVLEVSESRK